MSYYFYQQHFLDNPSYPHYDYITTGPRTCGFGETAFYTLISPLFQSIEEKPGLLETLLNGYYGADYISDGLEEVDKGERIEEGIGDNADYLGYLLLMLQTRCSKLYILSKETGEIITEIEITAENLIKRLEELLPSSPSNIYFHVETGDKAAPQPSKPEKYIDDAVRFGGYFFCTEKRPGVTYMMDGVRKHKPPHDTMWSRMNISALKTGWIVDAGTGDTTDEFYGSCNDFNEWFLGYAARGMKFFFFIDAHDGSGVLQADEVKAVINHEWLNFTCNQFGEWALAG